MCGIFGLITKPGSDFQFPTINRTLESLAVVSESRGQDSSGIAIRNYAEKRIEVVKGDVPVRRLLKAKQYRTSLERSFPRNSGEHGFCSFGHARLVTNGSQLQEVNNQPVVKSGIVMVHNGIIVNVDELWEQNSTLKREYSIDTEIIPALVRHHLTDENDLAGSCVKSFAKLEGTYSIAALFEDLNQFLLATNNGSLYYITDRKNFLTFASEQYFLEKLSHNRVFKSFGDHLQVEHLSEGRGLVVDLEELSVNDFKLDDRNARLKRRISSHKFKTTCFSVENDSNKQEVVIDPSIFINREKEKNLFELLENNYNQIQELKRCTKCILPETFPFIHYDEEGVCNYCRNYKAKSLVNSFDDLKQLVDPYRSKNGKPDCIVPFSGGRDSTYSLHIVKKELGLNPIAFTYDWGMVTDLARRNIARVCGKLGVENIIVSANIHWKRKNIQKNIKAWLKNPSLGMIPLFMAGDKFFFYYTNQVKKQTGIDLNIWGINHLENTEFKTGFAGLPPKFDKKRIYSLSLLNQLKLFGFVGKNIVKSPGYLNQSVIDSLGSFATRYIAPKKDYFHLFDYYRWDENEINELIKNEYKWETAIDTNSTWRIGDGTASFYNYIYYTVAGFSENDTFRSNQIREGQLSRESALQLIEKDNIPRYETLRWYLEIIGLDFAEVIPIVNNIPKLYK